MPSRRETGDGVRALSQARPRRRSPHARRGRRQLVMAVPHAKDARVSRKVHELLGAFSHHPGARPATQRRDVSGPSRTRTSSMPSSQRGTTVTSPLRQADGEGAVLRSADRPCHATRPAPGRSPRSGRPPSPTGDSTCRALVAEGDRVVAAHMPYSGTFTNPISASHQRGSSPVVDEMVIFRLAVERSPRPGRSTTKRACGVNWAAADLGATSLSPLRRGPVTHASMRTS